MTDQRDSRIRELRERYASKRPLSASADAQARVVLPGGNTRTVLDFAPFPFKVVHAERQHLTDIDGFTYTDFLGNYTAGLFGHSEPAIAAAVIDALSRGWALGATHELETSVAELMCQRFASVEQCRFTNSGTEANLLAIGTALQWAGRSGAARPRVVVFDHGYHGGVLAFGDVDGPHNPLNAPFDFVVAPYGDTEALADVIDSDVGCVLVEPLQGSGGCRVAPDGFLAALRQRCDEVGAVLIFDEVMTSRLSPGGAQQLFNVVPDLSTFGKYLAGGLPFGAFGGRREIMAQFDPAAGGTLTQAGTFNNNVLSMSAAQVVLSDLLTDDVVIAVNKRGDVLRERLAQALVPSDGSMWITGIGSMMCFHADDPRLIEVLFHELLDAGIYIARRGFIALSIEITDADCDRLVNAVETIVADPIFQST